MMNKVWKQVQIIQKDSKLKKVKIAKVKGRILLMIIRNLFILLKTGQEASLNSIGIVKRRTRKSKALQVFEQLKENKLKKKNQKR